MNLAIILSFILTTSADPPPELDDLDEVVSQESVDYINSVQSSWIASKEWVGSLKVGDAKKYLSNPNPSQVHPEYDWGDSDDNEGIPASFDSRVEWPNCVASLPFQFPCRVSQVLVSAGVLRDRICISTNGNVNPTLSFQYIVDCEQSSLGCNGGVQANEAWQFLKLTGTTTESCVPYAKTKNPCPATCQDNSAMTFYKAHTIRSFSNIPSIQNAIRLFGPIEVLFTLYQDFLSYSSGVYVHTTGVALGTHASKLIGWGVSGNQNYWICANSFGSGWGMQGYFWIAFGQCGIDSNGIAGKPKLQGN